MWITRATYEFTVLLTWRCVNAGRVVNDGCALALRVWESVGVVRGEALGRFWRGVGATRVEGVWLGFFGIS